MPSFHFILLFISTFFKRFKVVLALGVILGVGLFLSVRFLIPRLLLRDVEYVGVVGRHHPDDLPQNILSFVGDGLTKLDESGLPQPSLAKSWTAQDNGKTWVFEIDTTRKWHDGTPVTSHSIQYSFEDVIIERPDDATLIFKLQSAYAPFASVVSRATFKRGLLGTGEWKVVNLSVMNTYAEKLELVSTTSTARKLIRFYPNEEAAKTAFKLGQIDRIAQLFDKSAFDSWNTVHITPILKSNEYVGLFFNTRDGIFKDNKPLRQALAYAIDKTSWKGDTRALGPITQTSWAYNPQIKPYEYDVTRANELLKGLLSKEEGMTIKLTTNPQLLSLAEQIAKNWEAVGIKTQVQATSTLPTDYEAFLSVYEVSQDPDQYLTWHSTQEQTNVSHYANQRIDKLLEDGRLEMNSEKRKEIYLDFQRFLLEDVPAVFLYHPTVYEITRK